MTIEIHILIAAMLISIGIGTLTGIFGVGGGFLLTPLLMLISVPTQIAVGTGVATMVVNCTFGIMRRKGSGTVDAKLAAMLSIGSIIGVAVGVALLEKLEQLPPITILGKEHTAIQYILYCLFLIMLVILTVFLFIDSHRSKKNQDKPHTGQFAKISLPPHMNFATLHTPKLSLIPLIMLGLSIGLLTGLLGIGGGVLLLPALIYLVGQTAKKAAGTSLLLVLISSAIAAVLHLKNHNIDLYLWLFMLAGGIGGTYIGTHIGLKVKDNKLRSQFVWVVAAAVLIIAAKLAIMTFG